MPPHLGGGVHSNSAGYHSKDYSIHPGCAARCCQPFVRGHEVAKTTPKDMAHYRPWLI
jgi:hypothetical protein